MKQFHKSKRWLATLTMFTLVWTGTLWHDFFGLEVMPVITKSVIAAQEHEPACRQSSRIERTTSSFGQTEAGQLPCSCHAHVHSPSCLAKVYKVAVSSFILAVAHMHSASIMPNAFPANALAPRRDPPKVVAKKSGACLYLANRSLLI